MAIQQIPWLTRWFEARAEKRRQRARLEEEHKRKQQERLQKLCALKFDVYMRDPDGKKNTFETALVFALRRIGASPYFLTEALGRSAVNGEYRELEDKAILLTGFARPYTVHRSEWEYEDLDAGTVTMPAYDEFVFDYDCRFVEVEDGIGTLRHNCYGNGKTQEHAVNSIIRSLLAVMDKF